MNFRNIFSALIALFAIALFATDANAERIPDPGHELLPGLRLEELAVSGDDEISATWRYVYQSGSPYGTDVVFESVYTVSASNTVQFHSWFVREGVMGEHAFNVWSDEEYTLRNSLNGGGIAQLGNYWTSLQVIEFVTEWSGCDKAETHETDTGLTLVFEDCSTQHRQVR